MQHNLNGLGELPTKNKTGKRVIPVFLDYSGTIDNLLEQGAEETKKFFDSIIKMQCKFNCTLQITLVTGIDPELAQAKLESLHNLASQYEVSNSTLTEYPLINLFTGVIAEYCGFRITGFEEKDIKPISPLDETILRNKDKINERIEDLGGTIYPRVTSYLNITFDENSIITKEFLTEALLEAIHPDSLVDIEILSYSDKWGKQFDVKHRDHTKSRAVKMLVMELLENKYEIPCVIVGGDSPEEDLNMYTACREEFNKKGIPLVFIAPGNIGDIQRIDQNIIVASSENAKGIVDCFTQIISEMMEKEDGSFEIG